MPTLSITDSTISGNLALNKNPSGGAFGGGMYLGFVAAVLSALVVALWLSSASDHRITKENFDRIQPGMSKEQVEAVFGGDLAKGFSSAGPATVWYSEAGLDSLRPGNVIVVSFEEGKVTSKSFQPWTFAQFLKRLRNRLRF
jgi:hypothetical protein